MTDEQAINSEAQEAFLPPERLSYRLKRVLLGQPLVSERLSTERIGRPTALAVLSSDVMSSSAYATEQILIVLVLAIGTGAYSLVVPITIGILFVLVTVTLSYLQVIKAFPKAGGAYMVTRDTFGKNVAQIASAALLIDYTLTVAVSVAAGVDAMTSAIPALLPYTVYFSVFFVVLIAYGNLRGIREAGKTFAIPTFVFILNMAVLIVVGIVKWLTGGLGYANQHLSDSYKFASPGHGILVGASLFVMAQAFANGGTALTGTEAISNGVSIFKTTHKSRKGTLSGLEGQSKNARTTLVAMSLVLGAMFFGVSFLSALVHPDPQQSGIPTVVSQIASTVYGNGFLGKGLYIFLQIATTAILILAANTSFSGFPLLASFAAEDSFLPRQLMRRGHRLVFSNGILVLTTMSIILLVATRARVTSLIALYAIGVFTGFTMAGAGMVKHHLVNREKNWRTRVVINGTSCVLSFFVDLMFIVTKFTEGAWVVVVLMPLMVIGFIMLHRQYESEEKILEENAPALCESPILRRHVVIVLVERLDLATARAIQFARTLTPDDLRAVHFVLDPQAAMDLENGWKRLGLSRLPLDVMECGDRRLGRAVAELVADIASDQETEVSILLPRRVYVGALRRLLHDRTAERIAALVSQMPHASATIIPFQLEKKNPRIHMPSPGRQSRRAADAAAELESFEVKDVTGTVMIGSLTYRTRTRIAGRVLSVRVQPRAGIASLECIVADQSGKITLVFQGRRSVPGIQPGTRLVAEGMVGKRGNQLLIMNPTYELRSTHELDDVISPS